MRSKRSSYTTDRGDIISPATPQACSEFGSYCSVVNLYVLLFSAWAMGAVIYEASTRDVAPAPETGELRGAADSLSHHLLISISQHPHPAASLAIISITTVLTLISLLTNS